MNFLDCSKILLFCTLAMSGMNFVNSANASQQSPGPSQRSSSGLSENDVKVYTLEEDGTIKENDISKYSVEKYGYGFYVQFKENAKCVELKLNDTSMWKYDEGKKLHPLKVYFDTTTNFAILEFSDKMYAYGFSDSECAFVCEQRLDVFQPSDFKLFAIDNTVAKQLDENDYELSDYGYLFEYNLKDGVKCVELRFRDKDLWKHDVSDLGNEYPTKIALSKFNQMVFIFFKAFYLRFAYENDVWKGGDKTLLLELSDAKFTFVTSDPNRVNITESDSRYEKTGGNKVFTIKTKDVFKYDEIKYDGNVIWNHGRDSPKKDRPKKVILKLNENCVWVYFGMVNFNVYKFVNNYWKLVYSPETGQL